MARKWTYRRRKDNRTIEEVKQYYDFFHKNLRSSFKIKPGVEQISIDTDEKEAEQKYWGILKRRVIINLGMLRD
jgi:hypothetical protein